VFLRPQNLVTNEMQFCRDFVLRYAATALWALQDTAHRAVTMVCGGEAIPPLSSCVETPA
jgi:hypothetical protein